MTLTNEDVVAVVDELLERTLTPPPAIDLSGDLLAQIKAIDAQSITWQEWLQVIATVLATIATAFAHTQAEVHVSE